MTTADCKNFCYFISYVSVVFSAGQAGFCLCFFDTEYDDGFLIYDSWCLIEGVGMLIAGILLSYGLLTKNRKFVIGYFIFTLICLILYILIASYVFICAVVIMHYEFLVPLICWKIFIIAALVIVFKQYRVMDNTKIA